MTVALTAAVPVPIRHYCHCAHAVGEAPPAAEEGSEETVDAEAKLQQLQAELEYLTSVIEASQATLSNAKVRTRWGQDVACAECMLGQEQRVWR